MLPRPDDDLELQIALAGAGCGLLVCSVVGGLVIALLVDPLAGWSPSSGFAVAALLGLLAGAVAGAVVCAVVIELATRASGWWP